MRAAPASAAQTPLAPTTTGLSVSPFTGLRAPNIVELSEGVLEALLVAWVARKLAVGEGPVSSRKLAC